MRIDLAAMVRRVKNPRRRTIELRPIIPPAVMATDLFRSCYLPVVETIAAAIPRIMAEYERSLAAMTLDSPADVQRELDGLGAELQRLVLTLTPRLRDWVLRVERWQRGKWRGAVLSATGVDLQTMLGSEDARETLETVMARNASLVANVGAQAEGRISEAVFRGLTNRTPAREVAKEVQAAATMARDRAVRIASDQLTKATSALDRERRQQAGLSVYKHRHSGKMHPRENHRARDGKLYSENPAEVGKSVNGQRINAPVAPEDRAGVPPFCGCREQGVVVFEFD